MAKRYIITSIFRRRTGHFMADFHMSKAAIDRIRGLRGWTMERLAVEAGLAPTTLYECCKNGGKAQTIKATASALGVDWRELLIKEERDKLGPLHSSLILMHRGNALSDSYYHGAFTSGGEIIYVVTIGATFKQIDSRLSPSTTLKAAIWYPESEREVLAYRTHIKSSSAHTPEALVKSLELWDSLAALHSNVSVVTYSTTPTMSGTILKDVFALIELLPYGVDQDSRPALLLRNEVPEEKQAFRFFEARFKDLLGSASPRKPGEIPSWYRI
jgi:transcriptional regulator with XRE-family HTH domain